MVGHDAPLWVGENSIKIAAERMLRACYDDPRELGKHPDKWRNIAEQLAFAISTWQLHRLAQALALYDEAVADEQSE